MKPQKGWTGFSFILASLKFIPGLPKCLEGLLFALNICPFCLLNCSTLVKCLQILSESMPLLPWFFSWLIFSERKILSGIAGMLSGPPEAFFSKRYRFLQLSPSYPQSHPSLELRNWVDEKTQVCLCGHLLFFWCGYSHLSLEKTHPLPQFLLKKLQLLLGKFL